MFKHCLLYVTFCPARIQLSGMAKQLLPEDQGNEIVVSWARHQLLVTQFKEDERDGSSPYGMFDSLDPTVNFTSFLADDESIVDQVRHSCTDEVIILHS